VELEFGLVVGDELDETRGKLGLHQKFKQGDDVLGDRAALHGGAEDLRERKESVRNRGKERRNG
jgi:hypothetical protein